MTCRGEQAKRGLLNYCVASVCVSVGAVSEVVIVARVLRVLGDSFVVSPVSVVFDIVGFSSAFRVVVSAFVVSSVALLFRFESFVSPGITTGAPFVTEGTFSIRVLIPIALKMDQLRRSINLSVVLVMSVTTMSTPVMATIHTPSRATWIMASTMISTSLRNHSRHRRMNPRNLSKFDC